MARTWNLPTWTRLAVRRLRVAVKRGAGTIYLQQDGHYLGWIVGGSADVNNHEMPLYRMTAGMLADGNKRNKEQRQALLTAVRHFKEAPILLFPN